MSEVICEVAGAAAERIAVISGPNLAREIAEEQPTATVVACTDEAARGRGAEGLRHAYFRPYTNTDVVGCELGGAVKNVIALACGIAQGMGFGDNTLASVITRGLAETARLGERLGADPLTFAGLAGLGDLVATCNSPLSRNRTFGERLGRGESLEQAQEATHGQVAEGVKSCRPLLELAAPPRRRRPDHRRPSRRCASAGMTPRADARPADVAVDEIRELTGYPPVGSVGVERIRVAVVYGGRSSEHGISVVSAGSVLAALDPERYEVGARSASPRRAAGC